MLKGSWGLTDTSVFFSVIHFVFLLYVLEIKELLHFLMYKVHYVRSK